LVRLEAVRLLANALRECKSIPSIAQVLIAIKEAGYYDVIDSVQDERLDEAVSLLLPLLRNYSELYCGGRRIEDQSCMAKTIRKSNGSL
jgi:hypothetical protein